MRAAPRPANISMNDDALAAKNVAPDSCAAAFASNVFPVPGGPCRRMPLGTRAPRRSNLRGLRRKSTTSCSSARTSSTPATSAHVTAVFDRVSTSAGLTRGINCSMRQKM